MNPKIAAVQPDLTQQSVSGEARVQPGDQVDSRPHAFAIRLVSVEFMRAEILIDLPHAGPVPVRDAPQ